MGSGWEREKEEKRGDGEGRKGWVKLSLREGD